MNFVSNMVPARQDWLGWILAFFDIPIGEHPTLLGIGIQLKTDATSVLPKVVNTPSHPGNKVGPVLSFYSERLVTAEIAVQQ